MLFPGTESPPKTETKTPHQRFDSLLAEHGAALTRLAAGYTHAPADRDDILQEIALALWKALPRFRGECSERTFVFRIAHNRALSYLARVRSQPATAEKDVLDPSPDVETELARERRAERLRRAVLSLPVLYRQPVMLSLEGLQYAEIAEVLRISEKQCRSPSDPRAPDAARNSGGPDMNSDPELEALRKDWQSLPVAPIDAAAPQLNAAAIEDLAARRRFAAPLLRCWRGLSSLIPTRRARLKSVRRKHHV